MTQSATARDQFGDPGGSAGWSHAAGGHAALGRVREVAAPDGLAVCVHEFGPEEGRPVIMGHPMGYNAPVMGPLAQRLAGMRSYVPDLRGHGATRVAPDYDFPVDSLARDVLGCVDVVAQESGEPAVGFGHSLGAAALVLAEAMRPGSFRCLYLYEPAIMPPAAARRLTADNPSIAGMGRRRSTFASRDEAYDRYASRPPMMDFADDALAGYVEHGFVERPDGTVSLACLPAIEVQISVNGIALLAFERLHELRCPVRVGRGTAPQAPGRAGFEVEVVDQLASGDLVHLDDLNHFGPQQQPEVVAASLLDFVAGEGRHARAS
jgi:pimeloyl-ACP methyl ester carboxylesterase